MDDNLNVDAGIRKSRSRWQWGGPGGGSGGQEGQEVFRRLEDQKQTGDNSSGQVKGDKDRTQS